MRRNRRLPSDNSQGQGRDAASAERALSLASRGLFDDSPVGTIVTNGEGRILVCNRAFAEFCGRNPEQLADFLTTELFLLEDRDDITALFSKVVMGTMPGGTLQGVRILSDDQGERCLSLNVQPWRSDAAIEGLLLHVLDTTQHRNLELQFARAQKMQAIGQLASGIAHDFNNLLCSMLNGCEALLDKHSPGDPSWEDVMSVHSAVLRGRDLVDQLMAFARRRPMSASIVNVIIAIEQLSRLLRRVLGQNIELRVASSVPEALVEVNPSQLDQVIINLVVNARDAMPDGGLVTIRTTFLSFREAYFRAGESVPAGDYVVIEVSDTGSGIPKEIINQIFEPFFTTKDSNGGTGLGLSTVFGIVHENRGFIFVDSAPSEGTLFSVLLPSVDRIRADAPTLASLTLSRSSDGPRISDVRSAAMQGTVLLVDDERSLRGVLSRALRDRGFQVIDVDDGEGALALLMEGNLPHIDVLVADVVMPGIGGFELAREVRRRHSETRVIVMSGFSDEETVARVSGDPKVHFLSKPFTIADLVNAVQKAMTT